MINIQLMATPQDQATYHCQNIEGNLVKRHNDWQVEVPIMELPGNFVYYEIMNPTDFVPREDLYVFGDIYEHRLFKVKVVLLDGVSSEDHDYFFG